MITRSMNWGLKKSIALKLSRSYIFLEREEPVYLKKEFQESREPKKVPHYDEIDFLRLAKGKKELTKTEFNRLKNDIFEKGKTAAMVRKDLTTLMKERKEVDPEEERDKRNERSLRGLIKALEEFNKDMETLKLVPDEIIKHSKDLREELLTQLDDEKVSA